MSSLSIFCARAELEDNSCVLHHKNTAIHFPFIVQEFLFKIIIPIELHSRYNPDTTPWDILVFLKIKSHLKRFQQVCVPEVKL